MPSESHRDRLISTLPAEMQARVLKALQDYSSDGNDPVEACFAAVIEVNKLESTQLRNEVGKLRQQLVESELKETERAAQITKQLAQTKSDTEKARQEIRELSGKTLWKRIITSRIIGAAIWTVMVVGLTTYFVKTKVRTVDPAFHKRIDNIEKIIEQRIDAHAQIQNLRNDQLSRLISENTDTLNKTHVTTAAETLIGKGLSLYVSKVDEKTITVDVDGRRITVPHNLTPIEHLQLQVAIGIASKTRIK